MKATHHYLQITPLEFQKDCFERYLRWCENIANKNNIDLQKIIANTAIANYYNAQFKELLHEFKMKACFLDGNVSLKLIRSTFAEVMCQLYVAYPGALIECANNLNIENPPYAN